MFYFIFAALFFDLIKADALRAETRIEAGRVVSVNGSVLIRSENVGGPSQALKPSQRVYVGDVINTASNSSAKLLLADKTIIDIGPSALFNVQKYIPGSSAQGGKDRKVELNMKYGSLRSSVTKKIDQKGSFQVRTPAATMGVRGTEFVVNLGLPQGVGGQGASAPMDVVVLQGKVDVLKPEVGSVSSPKPSDLISTLSAGQMLSATIGDLAQAQNMPVQNLSTEQLRNASSQSTVTDQTFQQSINLETNQSQSENQSGTGAQPNDKKSEDLSGNSKDEGPKKEESPGVLNVTSQLITETISEVKADQGPPPPLLGPGGAGFIGAFDPAQGLFHQPVPLFPGAGVKVKIQITQ